MTSTGRYFTNPEHKKYAKDIHHMCHGIEPIAGDVKMDIIWYRKTKRGDIDSKLKTLLDSFNGYLYKDDSQITDLHIVRNDTDKKNPRMEVTVRDLFYEKSGHDN